MSKTLAHGMPNLPTVLGCPCFGSEYEGACICEDNERFLRALSSGRWHPAPLTPEQRAWCYKEIRGIGDAGEQPSDESLAAATDAELAHQVLCAWRDYCRDKGLY